MGPVWVKSVGLAAPGLAGWEAARAVLRGEAAYAAAPAPPYQPQLLPPNERRRATPAVRQAFRAAEDAMARTTLAAASLASVFASSDADIGIIDRICSTLAAQQTQISPTDFHNSVHNAAAGYWSIATAARGPSSTVSAYDGSFAIGLLEAAALVLGDGYDTLLVAYDVPPPPPLSRKRLVGTAASVALVLSADPAQALAGLQLETLAGSEAAALADAELEQLQQSNPAMRALPLLRLLALDGAGAVLLPGNPGSLLRVTLAPR